MAVEEPNDKVVDPVPNPIGAEVEVAKGFDAASAGVNEAKVNPVFGAAAVSPAPATGVVDGVFRSEVRIGAAGAAVGAAAAVVVTGF